MRAFVTGASGFVGRHLTAHLETEGDEVAKLADGIDVADEPAVTAAVAEAEPDVVYHLAGWAHVGDSWNHPTEVVRVNVGGTAVVLEACRTAGVARILVVGSADAYGAFSPLDLPLREDLPLRPVTPYGASKAAAEVLALQAHRSTGAGVVLTRSFNHTGPGQDPSFVVPALAGRIVAAAASGSGRVQVGNLSAQRDLLDVEDVVRAYRRLALVGEAGTAYNVCSGVPVVIGEVAELLAELSGTQLQLVVDPDLVRTVDLPVLVGDSSRLRGLGWQPQVPLIETLRRVLDDQRSRHGVAAVL
ncbi:MAG: UDP-glucose 4-epimerase [uncultured Acidimicrobiales bacterium]|uniref:UDP-glucose 4-epimerase n=1 Tax=uncultured Acidimicrobiales bacterium TaxID=310071 RepID=A0A6J4H413_9ACTN|nr:MAG: UDP-glucose 4-epimerase [uncultured Acidimicrobiales bacterium]